MAKCKNAWGDQELVAAMEKVKSKELSLRQAAITFGIPKSTLSDHVTGRSSKRYGGAPTVLSDISRDGIPSQQGLCRCSSERLPKTNWKTKSLWRSLRNEQSQMTQTCLINGLKSWKIYMKHPT